ncbi:hypothetical protein LTR56_007822 [Elasticomyces elasticus]|nr:hypothetical protein LTR56_007822 [Elasticomyces elasticus]KAK5763484.1 hypothetical protein LTS12_006455 [Elasticomyces elasticus]
MDGLSVLLDYHKAREADSAAETRRITVEKAVKEALEKAAEEKCYGIEGMDVVIYSQQAAEFDVRGYTSIYRADVT